MIWIGAVWRGGWRRLVKVRVDWCRYGEADADFDARDRQSSKHQERKHQRSPKRQIPNLKFANFLPPGSGDLAGKA